MLGQIAKLNSEYAEAVRLTEGLSGGLHVMLSFVERRINDRNPVDQASLEHLTGTLDAIGALVDEIRSRMGRRVWCVPYGRWSVYGAPLLGPCLGKAGSTKLVKRLTDLEGDLNGTIKFLELQMSANAVNALSALSEDKTVMAGLFGSEEGRRFWALGFGDRFSVPQAEFAARLARRVPASEAFCAYVASDLATSSTVDAGAFAAAVGTHASVEAWAASCAGGRARTAVLPGHHGAVTCARCTISHLVTGGADGAIKVFALTGGGKPVYMRALVGHNGAVTCLDASEADAAVVSGSADGTLRVWSLHDGTARACYGLGSAARCVSWSDGTLVYACEGDMCIRVRNASTGEVVSSMHGHAGGVKAIHPCGPGRAFSVGADRGLKEWTGDPRPARTVPQAHPNRIKFVVGQDGLLATVTNRTIRFYDPDNICSEAVVESVGDMNASVKAACVIGELGSVVVAIREKFGEAVASARLLAVFRSGARYETLIASRTDSVCSLAATGRYLYAGTDGGRVLWYRADEKGFSVQGSIGSAAGGSVPRSLGERSAAPLLASDGDSAVTSSESGALEFHCASSPSAVVAATATAVCRHGGGWAAACGDSVRVFDRNGKLLSTARASGRVSSVVWSKASDATFVDLRVGRYGRSICGLDVATGRETELACEPSAREACAPTLVLDDHFLVWPGYYEGSLAAIDARSMKVLDPVKFDHLEVDPVTAVASSSSSFVTVHGALDVLIWTDVASGPERRVKTYEEPVSSILLTDRGELVAGLMDGSVAVDVEEDSRVFVDHVPGRVLVSASARGVYSLGAEGCLVERGTLYS